MKLSEVKTNEDFEKYLSEKEMQSYDKTKNDIYFGACIDENGEKIKPSEWYWRGCAKEMNKGIG